MDNNTVTRKRKSQNAKHCEKSLEKARAVAAAKRNAAMGDSIDIDIKDINMDFGTKIDDTDNSIKQTSPNDDDDSSDKDDSDSSDEDDDDEDFED